MRNRNNYLHVDHHENHTERGHSSGLPRRGRMDKMLGNFFCFPPRYWLIIRMISRILEISLLRGVEISKFPRDAMPHHITSLLHSSTPPLGQIGSYIDCFNQRYLVVMALFTPPQPGQPLSLMRAICK